MTDSVIADTINRHNAALLVASLDALDDRWQLPPWYRSSISLVLMSDNPKTNSDRAWLYGSLVAKIPGVDPIAADGDWENLFSYIRTAIQDRRDTQGHLSSAANESVRDGVVSR